MENRETTTGQVAQCKKTDWFKKIYGNMVGDEEPRSITLPDGTRLELNPVWLDSYLSNIHVTPQGSISSTRRTTRPTTIQDELMERIFSSDNNYETTNDF